MNSVLLWLGGLLVALLCALFAVPHFVDWTRYRGAFEEEATRVLRRELRVDGTVNLRLLPTPYVRFEKVKLADAAGQTGEPFFRADDFTLWLAPGPLLRGAIEARQVELRRPTLKLRFNAAGGGNWQSLSIVRGSLPFVPSDVALQSVLITDGTISVDGADGQELVRLGGVNGEFSAAALEGPFKFKGTIERNGARHELKLSTTAFDSDGALRLKAQLGGADGNGTYVLDGRLADLSGRPKLDGNLTGQLNFHPAEVGRPPAAASTSARAPGGTRLPLDLRAAVTADANGAKLTDVGLAFEVDGKPQLIGGAVDLGWQGGLALAAQFNSRWLNLDETFAEKGGGSKPIEVARRLAAALGALVPEGARGDTAVTVDQVTLGAEALSNLKLRVERTAQTLQLTEFTVNAPGGSRASISGRLTRPDAFDGDMTVRGANLARLLAWLGYASATGEARTDGAYGLKAGIGFTDQSLTVKDAVATLGNATLTGSVAYRWSDRPRLDVVLDGDEIDLSGVAPKSLDLTAYARALSGEASTQPVAGAKSAAPVAGERLIDPRQQDATLRIRASRLRDSSRDLRDVDVDALLVNGKLALRRLRFVSATGLDVDAEGDVADIATRGHGTLRGTVAAADAAAVSELLAIVDHADLPPAHPRWRALAPARVAWSLRFGESKNAAAGTPSPSELWLDGAMLGRRLTAVARIDGGASTWRQAHVQVNGTIDRPDWQRVRAFVTPEPQPAARRMTTASGAVGTPATTSRARLLLNLAGRPDQALSAFLKLDDDAFDAGLAGKIKVEGDGIGEAEGELQIRTADIGQASAILGVAAANLPGVAVEGTADLALKDGLLRLTPSTLEVAGTPVGGEITVTRVGDSERRRIEGRITTTRANVPRLIDMLVEARPAGSREGDAPTWSAAAFDLALLDRVEGKVKLEAADIALTSDLSLSRGVAVAEFAPGKLDVTSLEGDLLGTRLASRWTIDKAPAGVTFSGTVKVADAQLDLLGAGAGAGAGRDDRRLSGRASLSASTSGRGLSPRGLVAALSGSGEIDITGGQIGAMSLAALRALSDDVINGKREPTVESMEKGVAAILADNRPQTRLAIGNRKLAFDIADGTVKLKPFTIETADGRATNRATLDLGRLVIDSEWRLEQRVDEKAPSADKKVAGPLPPVSVVFVGPAGSLGRLEQAVSVDALTRELAVRRMERDVEKLEELRRADAERARLEAERLKAEAAARVEAAAAAAAAAATPIAATPSMTTLPEAPSTPPSGSAPVLVPVPAIPVAGATPPSPTAVPSTTEVPLPAEVKRRPSGVSSEQRQVPSSQRYKGQSVQDVFKRQGGN